MTLHWKAFLGILLVFSLGILCGGFGVAAYLSHRQALFLKQGPVAVTDAMEKRLNRDLRLDDDQRQQIHQILTDASEQIKSTRKQIQPQIRAIQVEARQRITAILHPDQLERFHRLLLQIKKKQAQNAFNPKIQTVGTAPTQVAPRDMPTPIPPPSLTNSLPVPANPGN